jgi:hypothetical protein
MDKDEGTLWRNALYSIWLGYTTSAIMRVDQAVVNMEKPKTKTNKKYDIENENEKPNRDHDEDEFPDYSKEFARIDKLKQDQDEYVGTDRYFETDIPSDRKILNGINK